MKVRVPIRSPRKPLRSEENYDAEGSAATEVLTITVRKKLNHSKFGFTQWRNKRRENPTTHGQR